MFNSRSSARPAPMLPAVWERFEIEWRAGLNVISPLYGDCRQPGHCRRLADHAGHLRLVLPGGICGSCAMRINGKARMACSALVDNLEQPIRIEPLSKFPLVRDLQVDRSVLFENLKRSRPGFPSTALMISARARASTRSSRRPITRSRIASAAPAAWRFARSSTRRRALWARRRSRRSSSSTTTPPARC